jgi:C1A family cysteine protease
MAENYLDYSKKMAQEYALRLLQKPYATGEELAMYRPISYGRCEFILGSKVIRLNSEAEPDGLDATERIISNADNPCWDKAANQPQGFGTLPPKVDHRNNQTPIRDQKDRGTCVCFATLAAMEAIIKVEQGREVDLSEQFTNWVLMAGEGKNQCDDGLRTTLAARYLSRHGICEEKDFKYEDRPTVRGHCTIEPPQEARNNAKFGIEEFAIIEGLGLFGPSLGNPDYLESVLHGGYDIVFGTQVAWGEHDDNFVFDVILDQHGNPNQSGGGHAMLIVGYDRTGPKPFFIMKNSWGLTFDDKPMGKDGYFFMSYDYVSKYAKNGFIIKEIRTDRPTQ